MIFCHILTFLVAVKGQTRAQKMREQLPHVLGPRLPLKKH
jgi:hypothetical protein